MFNDITDNRESIGHVVIVLQLAKVKYWNGTVIHFLIILSFYFIHLTIYMFFCFNHLDKPQVGNALFGTKIYINSDLPEVAAFKER